MKKKLFNTVVFFLILGLLLGGAREVLLFKNDDGIMTMKYFYKQPDNCIDVLVLGSSHAYNDVNTHVLYDEYGVVSYILGGPNQPIWSSYYSLKEAFQSQKPELVLLECYTAARTNDDFTQAEITKNTLGIRTPWNKAVSIFAFTPCENADDYLFAYRLYHSRYKTVTRLDFPAQQARAQYQYFTGMITSFRQKPMEKPDISASEGIKPIREKEESYIRKIVELCGQNDIPIMLFLSPYAFKPKDMQRFHYVEQLADELGVVFINYNSEENYARTGIDFQTDLMDEGHMNWDGSCKFTHVLAEDMLSVVSLPDRRGDSKYEYWKKSSEFFLDQVNSMDLLAASSIEELLRNIHGSSNLVTFVYTSSSARKCGDCMELFINLGISDYVPEDGDLFRIDTNGARLASGSGLQWSYREDIHDHTIYADYAVVPEDGKVFIRKNLTFDENQYIMDDDPAAVYILVYNSFMRTLCCVKMITFDESGSPVISEQL